MKVSKKAAARAALVVRLEAQIAALTIAAQPTYGRSLWVEARKVLAEAKEQLSALAANEGEIEAAKAARIEAEAHAKAERAALHAARVASTKGPRLALVCIKTALVRKAKAIAQATRWVETLTDRAAVFALHADADQESFGQAAEMAATRRNQAERELAALMATSAMAFWK